MDAKILAIIEAAERHIQSFNPAALEGSELALARALADYGSETGKWTVGHCGSTAAELMRENNRLDRIRVAASAVIQFYANSSKDVYEADGGRLARTQFSRIFEQH